MSLTPEDIKELRRLCADAEGGNATITARSPLGEDVALAAYIGAIVKAAPALLDAVDALATMTRERDEARQYIPAAQSCHRLADYMSTNRDLLEYDGCDMAGDGAIDVLGRLARERDELRATIATFRILAADARRYMRDAPHVPIESYIDLTERLDAALAAGGKA